MDDFLRIHLPRLRLRSLGVIGAAVGVLTAGCPSALGANPIEIENAQPGSMSWFTFAPAATPNIKGYASEPSVLPGGELHLHVSTEPVRSYRVEVYRLGWYGGNGGRLMGCVPSCSGETAGVARSFPALDPTTGFADAGWPVTDSVPIGNDWVSGYYEAKLVLTSGPSLGKGSIVPFVVRRPATAPATDLLVQSAVNTEQAYNPFGGKSLYDFNSTSNRPASKVSFNRPLSDYYQSPAPRWEWPLARFLEREGYDVSYTTDVDIHEDPGELLRHRLDIAPGHSEYWSKEIHDAWDQARDAGVNLAFLGSNIAFWQVRYEDNDRTLVEYRDPKLDPEPDPQRRTQLFQDRPLSRPTCELMGLNHAPYITPTRDYTVDGSALTHPWFSGTGFGVGDKLLDAVGYEWDNIAPGCPAGRTITRLFHYEAPVSYENADAVTFTAASGARIFSSGSMQFNWLFDDYGQVPHADRRAQQFALNMLDDLSGRGIGRTPLVATNPAVSITTAPPASTSSTSARFGFQSKPGAHFLCSLDGSTRSSCGPDVADGNFSGNGTTSYSRIVPGVHNFAVTAVDTAGYQSAPVTRSWNVVQPGASVPASGSTGARLRLLRATATSNRITVKASAPGPGALTGMLLGPPVSRRDRPAVARTRSRSRGLVRRQVRVRRAGTVTLRLSLSKRVREGVRRALRRTRSSKLRLVIEFASLGGPSTTVSRSIRIPRARRHRGGRISVAR